MQPEACLLRSIINHAGSNLTAWTNNLSYLFRYCKPPYFACISQSIAMLFSNIQLTAMKTKNHTKQTINHDTHKYEEAICKRGEGELGNEIKSTEKTIGTQGSGPCLPKYHI